MPVLLDRIDDGGGGKVKLDSIDEPKSGAVRLDKIEPTPKAAKDFTGGGVIPPEVQDERDQQRIKILQTEAKDPANEPAVARELAQHSYADQTRAQTPAPVDSTQISPPPPSAAPAPVVNSAQTDPQKPKPVQRPVTVNAGNGLRKPSGGARPVAVSARPPRGPSVSLRPPGDTLYDPPHKIERRLATDVVPGALETTIGGYYNMFAGGLASMPAAIAAAFPDESDKTSTYIDRFTQLHGDIAHRLEYEPRTDTGKFATETIGKGVEWGLDLIGDLAYRGLGPEAGAFIKGSTAAALALMGMKSGLGLKPEAAIDRTLEPKFDPLSSVSDPRPEPTGGNNVLRPRFDQDAREPKMGREIEIIAGQNEPKLGELPKVPIPRSEKPRIRLTPEQVTGRTLPGETEVSAPLGSKAAFVSPEQVEGKTPRGVDPVLDKAVPVDLFDDMFKIGGDSTRPQPPVVDGIPKEDELPPAPKPAGVATVEDNAGYTTPDPDTEYTAFRQISSDSRKGGKAGGTQYSKLPQNLLWKGITGKVDAALFDAGKQFKTESTDVKVARDAAANKAKAFDKLQEALRYLMFEDKSIPPEAKAAYREFLTDDGTQLSRDKLIRGAMGYNARVSTIMERARRANEGRGTAIEVPGWGGKDMPKPEGSPKPPAKPAPSAQGVDELPQPPKPLPPLPKDKSGARGIDYNNDLLLTAIRKIGGIDIDTVLDVTGEKKVGPGMQQVFRKKGLSIDDMAAQLADEGYIPAEAAADVDGGVQWLRDAIRAEADGTDKFYSARGDESGRFARMQEEYGPGTLGAFAFNPTIIKQGLKAIAGALDKNLPKAPRRWMDAAQGADDVAMPAVGTAWAYARKVAAASLEAEGDIYHKTSLPTLTSDWRAAMNEAKTLDPNYLKTQGINPPTTVREVIQQTELARRHSAKIEMHREAIASGMASPVPLPGYSRVMLEDMMTKSGRPLWVLNEAKPIFEQMVGAHDVAAQSLRNKTVLGAAEALNHATVGAIMIDPMFHAVTVAGRAAPFIINKLGANSVLTKLPEARRMLQDRDLMYRLYKERGYQPMRVRQSMEALGSQQGAIEKIFRQNGLGKPYDFWHYVHNKVMVGTVNHIQAAVYLMKRDDLIKDGFSRDAAETSAARFANMIGGNLPKEEMNAVWHQVLGSGLFSRGYTSTVVRQTTRAIVQDKILMAALQRKGYTPDMVAKAVDAHRADLAKALMLDYFVMQATGNAINYANTADVADRNGKVRRHWAFENKPKDRPMGSKPEAADYLFPDRIAIGKTKDGSQDLYMENPLRTTRDQFLFFMQGKDIASGEKPRWFSRKIGTVLGLAEDTITGRERTGRAMRDPVGVAANLGGRMTPFDFSSAAEAVRMGSFDYFTEAVGSALSEPAVTGLKVIGLQPHAENQDPTTGASHVVKREQEKVFSEASEIASHWKTMSPETRKQAIERMNKLGDKVGIKGGTLEKIMQGDLPTKGQKRLVRKGANMFEMEETVE